MKLFIALVGMIVLASCSSLGLKAVKTGILTSPEFNDVLLTDVQQALILAKATDDELAVKCWTYVEKFVIENTPGEDDPALDATKFGVLSSYQQVRNTRRAVEVEISNTFRLECGPLLADSIGALGRIGIRVVSPL